MSRWVPASEDCWIDTAQVNDRRRRNVLVASVKHSRMKCATMLIDEYGADVNYQVWLPGVSVALVSGLGFVAIRPPAVPCILG
jgi:hypothetical protein